jgi:uncharacterized protein YggE
MRKLTLLTTTLLALQLTAFAEPEIKGTATELSQYLNTLPKNVIVTGEAEVRVPAHRAVLNLRVITESRSLQEALRLNVDARNRLSDYLKKQGITEDRIHASKFSSTPQFGLFGDKAKSYRIENVVRVAVQDDKEFQAAGAAVDQWAEVQFGGVEFEYADREALKAKVTNDACDNASTRKKTYEEKFGFQLTPVNFSEGIVSERNVQPSNYDETKRGYLSSGPRSSWAQEGQPSTEESISSLGELVYTARVSVEYSVQAK